MADSTLDYPNRKTQAQIDALPKLTIADFRTTLDYRVPEEIGASLPATPGPLTEAPAVYVLRTKTVRPATVNQDLVEFQDYVRRNLAVA